MSDYLEAENERLQREIESHQVVGQAAAKVMQAYLNEIAALESQLAESQKREAELREENEKAHFHLDHACDTYSREESARHKDSGFGVLAYRIHNAIKSEVVSNQEGFTALQQERDRLQRENDSQRVVAKAAGGLIQKQLNQISQLKTGLQRYTHCRHGCINCFCTKEAVAVLASADWDKPLGVG